MTNWHGAAEIKVIMPGSLIFSRECFSGHDPAPGGLLRRLLGLPGRIDPRRSVAPKKLGGGWWTGEEWFKKLWPALSQNPGADVFVFCNEWYPGNRAPQAEKDKFINFYSQLIDACTVRNLHCTVGDFSVGTPGYPTVPEEAYDVPAMQALMDKTERTGNWWNMHRYDVHFGAGLVDRQFTINRDDAILAGHPNLNSIAGEYANDGLDVGHKDGLYGGSLSLDFMRLFAGYGKKGCWWLWCNPDLYRNSPESRWDLDNVSDLTQAYFDWVIATG